MVYLWFIFIDITDCGDGSDEANCSSVLFECNPTSIYFNTVRPFGKFSFIVVLNSSYIFKPTTAEKRQKNPSLIFAEKTIKLSKVMTGSVETQQSDQTKQSARKQQRDLSVFESSCHLSSCLPHTVEASHCPFLLPNVKQESFEY